MVRRTVLKPLPDANTARIPAKKAATWASNSVT